MRLFFALKPPEHIVERLLLIQGGVGAARWQSAEQLHLTIRYIGETDRHMADALAAQTERLWLSHISVRLAAMGCFEHKGRIEHIWAGVYPVDALQRLHKQIDRLAVQCGLAPERRSYVPHITVARLPKAARGAAEYVAQHSGLTSEIFAFDQLILYESSLGRTGPVYTAIAEWPMTG